MWATAEFEAQLAEAEERILHAPNPDLIEALPITKIQIDQLPEELARQLFEALRLEIHYHKHTNRATCRVTLTGPRDHWLQTCIEFWSSTGRIHSIWERRTLTACQV